MKIQMSRDFRVYTNSIYILAAQIKTQTETLRWRKYRQKMK